MDCPVLVQYTSRVYLLRLTAKRLYDALSRTAMGQRETHQAAVMRDLRGPYDYYLCQVDHCQHASVPPPPVPGTVSSKLVASTRCYIETSSKWEVTDFCRYVPMPFAVRSERERWDVAKQVLTAIAESQQAPEPLTVDQIIVSSVSWSKVSSSL